MENKKKSIIFNIEACNNAIFQNQVVNYIHKKHGILKMSIKIKYFRKIMI